MASVADELCMIRTVHTQQFNHAPAQLFFHTGFERFGRPTLGSWLSYGLGSENQDLPGFVVLITGNVLGAGNSLWGSGFFPCEHRASSFEAKAIRCCFCPIPPGSTATPQGNGRRFNYMNRLTSAIGDPEIAARISQYELGFRMQARSRKLMDILRNRGRHIRCSHSTGQDEFRRDNCLLARRLVERGVRFVQLFDQGWDTHGSVFSRLSAKTKQVDQPIAALIQDLRQRGLLDETLVVWGREFGRTP